MLLKERDPLRTGRPDGVGGEGAFDRDVGDVVESDAGSGALQSDPVVSQAGTRSSERRAYPAVGGVGARDSAVIRVVNCGVRARGCFDAPVEEVEGAVGLVVGRAGSTAVVRGESDETASVGLYVRRLGLDGLGLDVGLVGRKVSSSRRRERQSDELTWTVIFCSLTAAALTALIWIALSRAFFLSAASCA